MDICSFVLLKDKVSDANLIAIKNKIEKLEANEHKIDILSVVPTLSSPNIGFGYETNKYGIIIENKIN